MTRLEARGARTGRGSADPALTLIHTNISPNPHGCSLSGPLAVRYGLEWGVSEAVVRTAFLLAVKLSEGGYARTTG